MTQHNKLISILLKVSNLEMDVETAEKKINKLFNTPQESKCPICATKMKGIVLTHYKCKDCGNYFTN